MSVVDFYRAQLAGADLVQRTGSVLRVQGLALEAAGPEALMGEVCQVWPDAGARARPVLAEVVGVHGDRVTLLPYGVLRGIGAGSRVVALGRQDEAAVGPALVGRILDGMGAPLDGKPRPALAQSVPLHAKAGSNPMERPRVDTVMETGVRAIDALLTLGRGQRIGIFAGSGVGKSSLLGMIARHAKADVNVVALIGERSREVREFVEEQLGAGGLARSVVIAATADQPALARLRAAHAAVAVAGYFREQGLSVLLTMDSITRVAMARREVGLAAGEPPTARGYTPSVFAELPQLCEAFGTSASGGSITALLTVLVEGDDLNEPVADSMRAILDGHIVLSRELAQQGHYPPIDILRSVSRVMPDLASEGERQLAAAAVRHLAALDRNRQIVELGAYVPGANSALDAALALEAPLFAWLRQDEGGVARGEALEQLSRLLHRGAKR